MTQVINIEEKPNTTGALLKASLTKRTTNGDIPNVTYKWTRTIDREDLTNYQRLCGYKVNDELPHTYPHILGFPLQSLLLTREDFPLALPGLVHISNKTRAIQPISVNDTVTMRVHASPLTSHPKGSTITIFTSATVDGEVRWESESVYLHRGKPRGVTGEQQQRPEVPANFPCASWKLPADLGRQYAKVSGDINPMHLNPLAAKALGFPRTIAHGMWTYARTVAFLGLGGQPATTEVFFLKPVLLPGKVDVRVNDDLSVAALTSGSDKVHLLVKVDA